MMKGLGIIINLLVFSCTIQGQVKSNIAGVYALQGVTETASAFKLNKDSTFEFYYSYGALDRYGSGKWSISDKKIILTGRPFPGKDFKIADSSIINNQFTTLIIKDQNPAFNRLVYCFFKTLKGDTLYNANEDGVIILPQKTDTINLLFELSSERISTFLINNLKFNSYTFNFEPWAVEVFFKNFELLYFQNNLEGKHPLLDGAKYTYVKEE